MRIVGGILVAFDALAYRILDRSISKITSCLLAMGYEDDRPLASRQ